MLTAKFGNFPWIRVFTVVKKLFFQNLSPSEYLVHDLWMRALKKDSNNHSHRKIIANFEEPEGVQLK